MALLIRLRIGSLLLVLFGFAVAATAQDPSRVGEVVRVAPKVDGTLAKQTAELKPQAPVFVDMEIETHRGAGARIAIEPNPRRGSVILGSRTIVQFTRHVVNMALGREGMGLLAKLGQIRMVFDPPPKTSPPTPREGEYLITTPDDVTIRLRGTDVVVQVDHDGTTTVWVIEGEVEVNGKIGAARRVPAGSGTRVRPGREPEPPRRFDPAGDPPGSGPLSPPEEEIFPDPPRLELVDLDLPGNLCF